MKCGKRLIIQREGEMRLLLGQGGRTEESRTSDAILLTASPVTSRNPALTSTSHHTLYY